jgi:hypothetical protein
MTEEQTENAEIAKESMAKEGKSSKKIRVPLSVSIEDILRASRIVMDKGGSVKFKEISTMFGQKVSDENLLGYSLGAAVAFSILNPHAGRAPYILSEFGKDFLTAKDEQQKKMLLPKFLSYDGYKDVLIAMRNSEDKSLKKQTITDMWAKIAGGTIGTRKLYTRTFASVGAWCGAIDDSGQTCSLKSGVENTLSQILKGEEVKMEPPSPTSPKTPPASDRLETQMPSEIDRCPICNKPDLIVNEKYLDKVATKGGTLLILERTFQCQGCSNKFTRIIRELVPSPD